MLVRFVSPTAKPYWKIIVLAALIISACMAAAFLYYRSSSAPSQLTEQPEAKPTTIVVPVKPVPYEDDTDGDGLIIEEEKAAGTDTAKKDTDGDGLLDGEEVKAYHTDPLKTDSDSDGHDDKTELQNGYNPTGPGRLGEIKTN